MHPYLLSFTLSDHLIHVPTYGVLLAFAFSMGYFWSLMNAIRLNEDPKHVENLFLIVVFSAVAGSRLFHVFFEEPAYYLANPLKIFALWEGGYTFYGALIVCTLCLFLYCRRTRINFLNYADICAPATALGLAIGRIGCFCAGCCWGKPTSSFLGVTFTHPDSFANLKGVPLHPSQLYESLGAFLIFLYLRWRFTHRRYVGELFYHGLMLYAVLRTVVEGFRGDDYRGYPFGGWLSTSQYISIGIFIAVFVAMQLRPKATTVKAAKPARSPKVRAARR